MKRFKEAAFYTSALIFTCFSGIVVSYMSAETDVPLWQFFNLNRDNIWWKIETTATGIFACLIIIVFTGGLAAFFEYAINGIKRYILAKTGKPIPEDTK